MSPFKILTPDCSLRNFRKLVGENSRYHGVLRDKNCVMYHGVCQLWQFFACRTDGLATACSAGYGNFTTFLEDFQSIISCAL